MSSCAVAQVEEKKLRRAGALISASYLAVESASACINALAPTGLNSTITLESRTFCSRLGAASPVISSSESGAEAPLQAQTRLQAVGAIRQAKVAQQRLLNLGFVVQDQHPRGQPARQLPRQQRWR